MLNNIVKVPQNPMGGKCENYVIRSQKCGKISKKSPVSATRSFSTVSYTEKCALQHTKKSKESMEGNACNVLPIVDYSRLKSAKIMLSKLLVADL